MKQNNNTGSTTAATAITINPAAPTLVVGVDGVVEENFSWGGVLRGRYDANGQKIGMWEFLSKKHGVLQVLCREYYEDGVLDGSRTNGIGRIYYGGDAVLQVESWEKGRRSGMWCWFRDRTVWMTEEWEDGHLNVLTKLYPDGKIHERVEYRDGERNGIRKTYYEDGTLESYEEWKDDRLHGERRGYNGDGTLWHREEWRNGKKHGVEEYYLNPGGELSERRYYENGEQSDLPEKYNKNGEYIPNLGWY